MKLSGHVAQMKEKMNTYMLLVGKPEGKRGSIKFWEIG
jgi:hypothetical protein